MKAIFLAAFLFSLPGLSLAESDKALSRGLSAGQIKSLHHASRAILTARIKATEAPGVEQFRRDIQTLREELQALVVQPIVASVSETVIQTTGTLPAPAVGAQARLAAKAKKNAAKQRVRDAMLGLREGHNQMKQRKRPKGPLPDINLMDHVSGKLIALQVELDDALAKPDEELHMACKTLLKRLEVRHIMTGKALDKQPTLSIRTQHRR